MSWRDKNWTYIPASSHDDASKFRERMEARKKQAEAARPVKVSQQKQRSKSA